MSVQSPDALLDALHHPLDRVIQRVRAIVQSAAPATREGVKWNAPRSDRAIISFANETEVDDRAQAFTAILRQWLAFVP
jgi:hypothetical protein